MGPPLTHVLSVKKQTKTNASLVLEHQSCTAARLHSVRHFDRQFVPGSLFVSKANLHGCSCHKFGVKIASQGGGTLCMPLCIFPMSTCLVLFSFVMTSFARILLQHKRFIAYSFFSVYWCSVCSLTLVNSDVLLSREFMLALSLHSLRRDSRMFCFIWGAGHVGRRAPRVAAFIRVWCGVCV